jgi:hypothetical protein
VNTSTSQAMPSSITARVYWPSSTTEVPMHMLSLSMPKAYEVVFYGDTKKLSTKLSDKLLEDIDWSDYKKCSLESTRSP